MFRSAKVVGAKEVSGEFKRRAVSLQSRINRKTRHFSQLLQTRVQANASGRPGPNAPTGDYRRSWNTQYRHETDGVLVSDTGTNKPQGRRLENGFHGVDSLGRSYNQPPFPHVDPALQSILPEYVAAVQAEWAFG